MYPLFPGDCTILVGSVLILTVDDCEKLIVLSVRYNHFVLNLRLNFSH